MERKSSHEHYLHLCRTVADFYRAYTDVALLEHHDTSAPARCAYLFAAFTAAIHVVHAYGLFVDAIRQESPNSTQGVHLERAMHHYAGFQHVLTVLQRHIQQQLAAPARHPSRPV